MRLLLPGGVQSPDVLLLAILATFVQSAFLAFLTEPNNAGHVISRIMSADEAFRFLITKYFPLVDNFSASMLDARDIITQKYADIDTLVHCNEEPHSSIQACLQSFQVQVINSLSENKLTEARIALGKALSTVQVNAPSQDIVSAPEPVLHYLENIKQKIGNLKFRLLFGVGPTLAVIVDTAGSMTEIMQSALAMVIPIVKGRLETGYEPSTYLIATFDVAGAGPIIATSDFEIFQSALYSLEASGGVECTRLAMAGLLNAMEILDEGSDLIFFTDAIPEDVNLATNVVAMAIEKQISLQVFRVESHCDDSVSFEIGNSLSKKVYTALTSATGGTLRSFRRSKGTKAGGVLDSLVTLYEELMLEIIEDLGTGHESRVYSIPVESHVTGLVISLTGPDLRMRVNGPAGMVLISSFPGADHIKSSEGELWKINDPTAGSWTVRLSGTGAFSLDVTAITHIHFPDAKFPAEKVSVGKLDKAPRVRRHVRYGNFTTTGASASGAGATSSIVSTTTMPSSSVTEISSISTTSSASSSIFLSKTVTAASSTIFAPTNSTNPKNTLTVSSGSATNSVDPNSSIAPLSTSFIERSSTTGATLLLASPTSSLSLSIIPGNSTSIVPSTTVGASLAKETSIAGAAFVLVGSSNATTILTALPGNFTSLASLVTTSANPLGNGSTLAIAILSLAASINSTSTVASSRKNTTSLTVAFPSVTSDTPSFGNSSTTITLTLSLVASVSSTRRMASSTNSTILNSVSGTTASYTNGSTMTTGTQCSAPSLTSSINSTGVTKSSSGSFIGLTGVTFSTTRGTPLFGNGTSLTSIVSISSSSIDATSIALSAGNTTSGSKPTAFLTGLSASFGNEIRTDGYYSQSTALTTSFSIIASGASNRTGIADGLPLSTDLTISTTAPIAPFVYGIKAASSSPTGTDSVDPVSSLMPSHLSTPSSNITYAFVSGGSSSGSTGRTLPANSNFSRISVLSTSFTHAPITTRSDKILTIDLSTSGRSLTSAASLVSSSVQSSFGPLISGSSAPTEITELPISDTYVLNDDTKRPISSESSLFDPTVRPISITPTSADNIQAPALTTSYYTPTATEGLSDLTDYSEFIVTEIVYTTTSYCPTTVCSSTSGLSSCIMTNSVSTITLTSTVVVPCNRCLAPSHLITASPAALPSATSYHTPSYNDLTVIEIIYITASLCPITSTGVISGSATEHIKGSTSTLTLTLTTTKSCVLCGPNRTTITLSLVSSSPGSSTGHFPSPSLAVTAIASVVPPHRLITLIGPSGSGIYQCEGLGCGTAGDFVTSSAGTGCGGSGCESLQIHRISSEATIFVPGGSESTRNPADLTIAIPKVTSSCESTGNLDVLIVPTATTPIGKELSGAPNSPVATILTLQIGSSSPGTSKGIHTATVTGQGVSELPGISYSPSAAVTITIDETGSAKAPIVNAATITRGENGSAIVSHGLPAAITVTIGENGSARTSYVLPVAATINPTPGRSGSPTDIGTMPGKSGLSESPHGLPAVVTATLDENGPAQASHGTPVAVAFTLGENGPARASYGMSAAAATTTHSGGGLFEAPHSIPTPVAITLSENGSFEASHGLPSTPIVTAGTPHGLPSTSTTTGAPRSLHTQITLGDNGPIEASQGLYAAASPITLGTSHIPPTFSTITLNENWSAEASHVSSSSTTTPGAPHGPLTHVPVTLVGNESAEVPYELTAAASPITSVTPHIPTASLKITAPERGLAKSSYVLPITISFKPGESQSSRSFDSLLATQTLTRSENGSPEYSSNLITAVTATIVGNASPKPSPIAAATTSNGENGLPEASNTLPAATRIVPGGSGSAGAPSFASFFTLILPPSTTSATISNGPLAALVTPDESGLPEASNTHPNLLLTTPRSAGAPNIPSASMLTLTVGGGSTGGPNSVSSRTLTAPLKSESSTPPVRTASSTITSTNGYHGPYFTGGSEKTFSFAGQCTGLGFMVTFVAVMVML